MTRRGNNNAIEEAVELLSHEGQDGVGAALRELFNAAMQVERSRYLQAEPYERTAERRGHSNGYKDKTLRTRVGEMRVSVPQVREGGFYPTSLDQGLRSERALKLALAEMYVQGVSTRKVKAITQKLCGFDVTSDEVSRASKELDKTIGEWRNRPISSVPYLSLDARYEKVRSGGIIVDCAVLIAYGIRDDGRRTIVGVSVSMSEAEVHWREFLESLLARGIRGIRLITSDAHSGLKAARKAVFPGVPWQRCQFHLQRNARSYIPKKQMERKVFSQIRSVFQAPNRAEADRLLNKAIEENLKRAPKLSKWLEENIVEGLTAFSFPEAHRPKIRTTNGLERINREVKRRTSVAGLFPNEASCLRLVSAVLMEISDDWELKTQRCLRIDAEEDFEVNR